MAGLFFVMSHDTARARAADAIATAPEGWHVRITPPKRNLEINAALHATLQEIAERMTWAGRRWDVETWKRLMVAAWERANKRDSNLFLPAIDGHGMDVVFRRTSEMTQDEMRDLMGFVDAWCAEQPELNA